MYHNLKCVHLQTVLSVYLVRMNTSQQHINVMLYASGNVGNVFKFVHWHA